MSDSAQLVRDAALHLRIACIASGHASLRTIWNATLDEPVDEFLAILEKSKRRRGK